MKKLTSYADPFLGNGEIDLPKPYFPASSWNMIKGLSGNTSSGATLPFGKYCCLPYSGGYPCGCGNNQANYGEPPKKLFDKDMFIGISHFCQSGTGAIGVYYNYAVCHPFYGEKPEFEPTPILNELAQPGFYAVSIKDINIDTTVSEKIALHRYCFEKNGGKIAIDFANDGLYVQKPFLRGAVSGKVELCGKNEVMAQMKLSGVELWFYVKVTNGKVSSLFINDDILNQESVCNHTPDKFTKMGCILDCSNNCELRISCSAVSADNAKALLEEEDRDFNTIRTDADKKWEEVLSKIEITTPDAREKTIFYSNLYHTLVKPADFSDEAFLFNEKAGDFVTDIATMWDIYKTQLPLLFTLYPEISLKIMNTLQRFGEEYGYLPHCLLLSDKLDIEAKQARMLSAYTVCDAFYRGIHSDYKKMLKLCEKDAMRYSDFFCGKCEFASHTLDMAEAFTSLALVAEKIGQEDMAERFFEYGRNVKYAFDNDGLMKKDSQYYEGNRYNYSFRPMHDLKIRTDICGIEYLREQAKIFFGFEKAQDLSSRFEGFNNETDIETPYFLNDIGLRDEMCSVIKSGTDCMFTTGKGGIPGNADSGGLTAAYIWNVIGLFPISGTDRMIIGTPRYAKTVLHMPKGDFIIERIGSGIKTEKAVLCGETVNDFNVKVSQMINGGTLQIYMKE